MVQKDGITHPIQVLPRPEEELIVVIQQPNR